MKKLLFLIYGLLLCSMDVLQGTVSTPVVSRVRGDQYTPGIVVSQPIGDIGALDITFGQSLSGNLNVNTQLSGGTAQAMQVLSDGTFLVVMSKSGSDSNVGKYNAEGTLLTSGFGTLGIADLGASTELARAMMLDVQGRILVAGGATSGSAGWLQRLSSDGTSSDIFSTGTAWQYIAAIAEQNSGEIIAVGFNGTNAQIARYQLDGTLDASFGTPSTPGYIMLNGATSGLLTLPTVATGLYSVVVDANNLIYVAYPDSIGGNAHIARFTAVGLLDATFGTSGIANISFLNSATSSIYMAIDLNSNLVAAAQVGTSVLVTSIASSTGGAAIPTFTNAIITSGGSTLTIGNLVTTSDGATGKILVMGSMSTLPPYSRVTRLTATGALDTTFNAVSTTNPSGTPGYNQFRIGTPDTTSTLLGAALSPDGQLYVVGYQRNGATNTGYVSRLYNNFDTYQVSQSPSTKEQGDLDFNFGSTVLETDPGIVTPFNGMYRGALQQKANYALELLSGKIIIGMDGYSNTAAQSSMMLIRLLSTGVLDGSFGSGGKLTLTNITGTNEYISSILEDGFTNLYVTGYSDDGAIFRKYTSAGTLIWNSDMLIPGYKGLGTGLEGSNRVLLFAQTDDPTKGQISGYVIETGDIDTSFHSAGTPPGYVLSTDYTDSPATVLNMGPVYGGVINGTGNIYIAYKDCVSGVVDVAGLFNAAPGLISSFGVSGIVHDLFSTSSILAQNIHIAFDKNFNCIVAASVGSTIKVVILDAVTGDIDTGFNGGAILTITVPGTTSVMVNKVTGVSDGSLMITGYDNGADDTMLVVRVDPAGTLDTTFNSQGETPGIFTLKVGDQVADFNARVATSLTMQSHTGINQGNLIISAYEKQFSSDSTPMVYRVFGQPGTTEVKGSPVHVVVPGDFDVSYNGTGKATTYANGASSPTSNQEVKAIREMTGMNIMTVISDNINSWTTQLENDSTLYTSYGSGGSALIAKGNGSDVAENVNTMVFDGDGNMLVVGYNAQLGGYVKRILISGAMDTTFGGYTGDPATASYPAGTAYGIMSSVESIAQLSNGNLAVVGNRNGVGMVMMLSATGVPLTTFGTNGLVSSGINITSVSVDSSNNIYVSVGYLDTDLVKKVRIMKLNATGVLVASYGVGGVVNAALSNIDNYTSIRLVLNQVGKVVVAASFGGSVGQVAVLRFNTDGSVDTTFNSGVQQDVVFSVSTTVQVTSLIALQDGKTLVAGYQFDSVVLDNDDYEFVACIDAAGNMDGAFGSGATAGLVTFQIATDPQLTRRLYDMNIQTNGGVLLAGSESPDVNENTPFTARLYGFDGVQSVAQFPGYQSTSALPNLLDTYFNGTGIADTGVISLLANGGDVVVDSSGRPVIGGYTTDLKLVVARFTTTGALDSTFGSGGIAQTVVIPNLLNGQHVAVDSSNNIYIGGVTNDFRFVLARFTSAGVIDTAFGGGIVQSAVFANLSNGGYVTVDSLDRPVIGGSTSDGKLVVARFTTSGSADSFGSGGIAFVAVPSLNNGGFVTTNSSNQVFISGITSLDTLVVAKFSNLGVLDSSFGTSGIASSSAITSLSVGGSIGIDSLAHIIVGGCTTNETLVVVEFTSSGVLNSSFGTSGITYSNPVDGLNLFSGITIDSQDRIVIGGYATEYDDAKEMVVARFTPAGNLDTVLSATGMGTTGTITGLVRGGYVATNVFDNIFMGGFTSLSTLVVAELYSGQEIFVIDPSTLNPEDYKIHEYGNNPDLFEKFLAIELFARFITSPTVQSATLTAVYTVFDQYIAVYAYQPGWNLLQSTYRVNDQFDAAQADLIATYSSSTAQINKFFTLFNNRRAYFYPAFVVV